MSTKDVLGVLGELTFEITSTTKLLESIPEGKINWRPHERAMSLGQLAYHVASIPGNYMLFAEAGKTELSVLVHHHVPTSKKEIMDKFPASIATATKILENVTDEWAKQNWELLKDGTSVFSIPRAFMCRLLVLNHWYHHRGQLVTYLRTLDMLIPSIYGPSADDNPFA